MLEIVDSRGEAQDVARVYVARLGDGAMIELAEATQPPVPIEDKWVLIVSTLKGCPIRCPICDAGGGYQGKLSAEEILGQIDFLVARRFPLGLPPIAKLKIQFARMGDPALNDAVLEVLRCLPGHLGAPGLMPCLSTIAPAGREEFFAELLEIRHAVYGLWNFQLQFSLHTTCERARAQLVPTRTWTYGQMAAYGERFFAGGRKITLNLAPARGLPLEAESLLEHFDPERFIVKLTPINPSAAAQRHGWVGVIDALDPAACAATAEGFRRCGYETILSVGELDENRIGSNCGMMVRRLEERTAARATRARG